MCQLPGLKGSKLQITTTSDNKEGGFLFSSFTIQIPGIEPSGPLPPLVQLQTLVKWFAGVRIKKYSWIREAKREQLDSPFAGFV